MLYREPWRKYECVILALIQGNLAVELMGHIMSPVVVLIIGMKVAAFLGGEGGFVTDRTVCIGYVVEEICEVAFLRSVVNADSMYVGQTCQSLDVEGLVG